MMAMDGYILFYGNINPYLLSDEEWVSAYNSLEYIIREQNKNNKD